MGGDDRKSNRINQKKHPQVITHASSHTNDPRLSSQTAHSKMKSIPFTILPYALAVLFLSFPYIAYGKQNEGNDLDPDADLRVGVKKRVKPCE